MKLLFLLAAATMTEVPVMGPPDFSITVNGSDIPIRCSTNEVEIAAMLIMANQIEIQSKVLRQRRYSGKISVDENNLLFGQELTQFSLRQMIAAHNYAGYYCKHPEEIPKTKTDIGV